MSSIGDFLAEKASKQLDKATGAVEDGKWFDSTVKALRKELEESELDKDLVSATSKTIDELEKNKKRAVGLGADAFTLFIHQLASGRSKEAEKTYMSALGSADAIIKAMNQGTRGLIKAKEELDRMHDEAIALIKNIATAGARHLLPLLLNLGKDVVKDAISG